MLTLNKNVLANYLLLFFYDFYTQTDQETYWVSGFVRR